MTPVVIRIGEIREEIGVDREIERIEIPAGKRETKKRLARRKRNTRRTRNIRRRKRRRNPVKNILNQMIGRLTTEKRVLSEVAVSGRSTS